MKNITVLMTGAGAPGASGIIKCLRLNGERDIRIIGCDMKERVGTRCLLDGFEQIPPASSPDFVETLLAKAVQNGADVVLPLVTRELELLSGSVSRFAEAGIKVCVCPAESLHIANDKGLMLDEMKKGGLPVPGYVRITRAEQFAPACKALGYPEKTVCFKPTHSNGSRGFRIISPDIDRATLLFGEKPNSTYMDFDDAVDVLTGMDKIPELLVMEYLPGSEYSIDMFVDNGNTLAAVPRKRLAMNGGISVSCLMEDNREIIDYCTDIARVLRLDGNIGIQVRADCEGRYRILEINPRVQGTIVACLASGVNFPYLAVKRVLGETVSVPSIRWGVSMCRYWDEVYFDENGAPFSMERPHDRP